jgi:hypothetical protein
MGIDHIVWHLKDLTKEEPGTQDKETTGNS